MTQPTPYSPAYSFTDFSSGSPTSQPPGDKLDAEFSAISNTLTRTLANLALLQRDDTALANDSVGIDQLNDAALALIGSAGFVVKGDWLTLTDYVLGDVVSSGGLIYLVVRVHTSGVLATDVAAGKLIAIFDPNNTSLQTLLAASTGAALIGSTGGITVQAALNLKASLAALAANGGAALVGTAAGVTVEAALALKASYAVLAASGGSANIGFLQAGTDAVARTSQAKMREVAVSVTDFNAKGDATADDTAAIQAAINHCLTNRIGTLTFPATSPGNYYKITAPLTCNGPLRLVGASEYVSKIIGVGMSAGQHIIDFDCLAADNVENVEISGLTVRSLDGVPKGIRIKNASYVVVRSVRVHGLVDGITIEGTRCFTHSYYDIQPVSISGSTVKFATSFTGGGQFGFFGCTFSGALAFCVPSTSFLDNLNFQNCNWEQCTSMGLDIQGTVAGLCVAGCRTEGGDTSDFNIRPALANEYVGGINISGTIFSASDSSGSNRIILGGALGKVRGFSICGNVVTHGTDTFGGKLVQLNGDGESGIIAGNFVRGTNATGAGVVNTSRAGVLVYGNENLSGKLANQFGVVATATWDPPSVASGAQTTTTIALTGAALGDVVAVSFSNSLQGLVLTGYVSSANTITVVLSNLTGGAVDLASGTLTATIR